MNRRSFLLLAASALLWTSAAPAQAPLSPELKKEITDLAVKLRDGGKAAALKLKPTQAQIDKIAATPDDAKALGTYSDSIFATVPEKGLGANPGQTEVFVTTDLPGGYARTTSKFKPGTAIYAFKFVKPGETSGMAYDGLMKVDGAWIMIPKAWRAFPQ